jgi:tRNA(fMet)-specific endonuclease VapC
VGALIDTSVLIDLERGRVDLESVASLAPASISVITTSELLHGTHRAVDARTRERRRGFVEQVLDAFEPLPITSAVARTHASIWAAVTSAGTPVDTHDLWIAATALVHGLTVVTENVRDFSRVPGLDVVAPSQPETATAS